MTQERNCENCAHYHMEAYEYPCNVCEASYDNPPTKWESEDKPQTNADHIRGMTDNEMARELIPLFEELFEDGIPSPEWFKGWLQQPYKENDHDM